MPLTFIQRRSLPSPHPVATRAPAAVRCWVPLTPSRMSGTSPAAPLGAYSRYLPSSQIDPWGYFLSGGCFKPCTVAKEMKKKKKLLCQKEVCAVMSFHNCLRITNYGLSLLLDLRQRTLASIKGLGLVVFFFFPFFVCQELRIMPFLWHGPYTLSYSSPCL